MTKFVYDFSEGNKDLRDLLGGKGANLAEMTNLGLPVPPGFTITTEACRAYLDSGHRAGRTRRGDRRPPRRAGVGDGRKLGEPGDPLLVSVRSGAAFSMPGMMETVLNVGLNDASVDGLSRQAGGNDRFAWDSYRRLIQMFGKTVCDVPGEEFEHALDAAKRAKGSDNDLDLDAGDLRELVDAVQEDLRQAHRPGVPAGPEGAARPRHPRGLRVVERRPGGALPPPGADPGRPRHRGQRGGDGVRQPRLRLRHRRRVHPRPGHRRAGRLRRLPGQRAGRGRGRRHPQHRAAAGPGAARQGVVRRADADHGHAGGALQGPLRHRVHHRARQALDAADPGRQAHGRGRVHHRRPARRRGRDRPRRGAAPGHRRAARPADVPAVRPVRRRPAS